MMLDFLHKQVVSTFEYSNVATNRNFEKKVLVNGHNAVMTYTAPIAVMECVVYKVYDHSVKSFKYVLHAGIGEQDVRENVQVNIEALREKATENMLMSPVMTVTFDSFDENVFDFSRFCEVYFAQHKTGKHVMTMQEVQAEVQADDKKTAYGRKYPYDWAYFKIYQRTDVDA